MLDERPPSRTQAVARLHSRSSASVSTLASKSSAAFRRAHAAVSVTGCTLSGLPFTGLTPPGLTCTPTGLASPELTALECTPTGLAPRRLPSYPKRRAGLRSYPCSRERGLPPFRSLDSPRSPPPPLSPLSSPASGCVRISVYRGTRFGRIAHPIPVTILRSVPGVPELPVVPGLPVVSVVVPGSLPVVTPIRAGLCLAVVRRRTSDAPERWFVTPRITGLRDESPPSSLPPPSLEYPRLLRLLSSEALPSTVASPLEPLSASSPLPTGSANGRRRGW